MTTYSRDFKLDALKLSDDIGVRPAAKKLGVPYETLANWRRSDIRLTLEGHRLPPGKPESRVSNTQSLQQEIQELKRTNTILLDAIKCMTAARM